MSFLFFTELLFQMITAILEHHMIKYQLYTVSNETSSEDYTSMLTSSQTATDMEKNSNLVCCGGWPIIPLLEQVNVMYMVSVIYVRGNVQKLEHLQSLVPT